jgi:hypothetical protein
LLVPDPPAPIPHPPPAPGPPEPPAPPLPPELLLLHVDAAMVVTASAPTAKTALHVCCRIALPPVEIEGDNIAPARDSLK